MKIAHILRRRRIGGSLSLADLFGNLGDGVLFMPSPNAYTFQDTSLTPAGPNDPAGLVFDQSAVTIVDGEITNGPGPELSATIGGTNGTNRITDLGDNTFRFHGDGSSFSFVRFYGVTIGKTYIIEPTVVSHVSGGLKGNDGADSNLFARFTATPSPKVAEIGAEVTFGRNAVGEAIDITVRFSVREIPGAVAQQGTSAETPVLNAAGTAWVHDGTDDSLSFAVPAELQKDGITPIVVLKTTDTDFRGLVVDPTNTDTRVATFLDASVNPATSLTTSQTLNVAGVELFNPTGDEAVTTLNNDTVQIVFGLSWDLSSTTELSIAFGGTPSRHFNGEIYAVALVDSTDEAAIKAFAKRLANDLGADWYGDDTVESLSMTAFLSSGQENGQWREHNLIPALARISLEPWVKGGGTGTSGSEVSYTNSSLLRLSNLTFVEGAEYTISFMARWISGPAGSLRFDSGDEVSTAVTFGALSSEAQEFSHTFIANAGVVANGFIDLTTVSGGNRVVEITEQTIYRSDNGGMVNAGTFNADAPEHPFDTSRMWQDSAGTTPVVSDGDRIGLYSPSVGTGSSWYQPSSPECPTLDGATGMARFDGTDDNLLHGLTHWTTEQRKNMTFECLLSTTDTRSVILSSATHGNDYIGFRASGVSEPIKNMGAPNIFVGTLLADTSTFASLGAPIIGQGLVLFQAAGLDLSAPDMDTIRLGTRATLSTDYFQGLLKPLFCGPTPGAGDDRLELLYRQIRNQRYLDEYARIGLSYS